MVITHTTRSHRVARQKTAQPRRARLRLEELEHRVVPAVSFKEFAAGITPNSAPTGLVVDASNNVWFTEQNTARIARLSPSGTVTEFSQGITPGSMPTDITRGPDGNLWFTEQGTTSAIGRITPSGTVTEFKLASNAHPVGITTGPDGALWFTELNANKIGRLTTRGTLTEWKLTSGSGPEEIITGPDGALWFTEWNANKIGRITTAGIVTEFGTPDMAGGAEPSDLTVGPDGNIWFTEAGHNRIGRLAPQGVPTQFDLDFSVIYGQSATPLVSGLTVGSDGNLWFTEFTSGKIGRMTSSGSYTLFDMGLAAGSNPVHMATGPDGQVWFTEQGTSKIGRLTLPPTQFSTGITPNSAPTGLVVDASNNVWFTEQNTARIAKRSPSGTVTEFSQGITPGSMPTDITRGPDGNLWFTEEGTASAIGRITPSGTVTEFKLASNAHPVGITTGPDGALWFTELNANKIGRLTTRGTLTEWKLTSGSGPEEIITGPDGALWFTEWNANKIGRITTAGIVTEFGTPDMAGGAEPSDLTVGPDGNIWFTEAGHNRIGRLTPRGVLTQFDLDFSITYGQSTTPLASGLTVGSDGNLWFTEFTSGRIGRITPSGSYTLFDVGLGAGSNPVHLATGPDGQLWFTEQGTSKIGKVSLVPTLTVSAPSTSFGTTASVTVKVALVDVPAAGKVVLQVDGGAPLTGTLDSTGTAVFQVANLSLGLHTLTAGYAGGPLYTDTTASSTLWVSAVTTIQLNAPAIQVGQNGSVTATLTSAAGTPAGNVALTVDNGTPLTRSLSAGGVATWSNLSNLALGNHTLKVSYTGSGTFASSSVTGVLTVTSVPATHFQVTTSTSATAGSALVVTVKALDANNQPADGYTGTIQFSSGDTRATWSNYTFTAADHGVHQFTSGIIFRTAGDWTLTVADTKTSSTLTGTSATFTINASFATHFGLSVSSLSVKAGKAFQFTVAALDAFGNVDKNYIGRVGFGSSDTQAKLPAIYAFTSTDQGQHTFTATFNTLTHGVGGGKTLTVTQLLRGRVTGTLTGIQVTAVDRAFQNATAAEVQVDLPASPALPELLDLAVCLALDQGEATSGRSADTQAVDTVFQTDIDSATPSSRHLAARPQLSAAAVVLLGLGQWQARRENADRKRRNPRTR